MKDDDGIHFEIKSETKSDDSGCIMMVLSVIVGVAVGNLTASAPWGWLAFVGAVVVLLIVNRLISGGR